MKTTNEKDIAGSYRTPDGKAQIDFGITYRNGYPEFTAQGYYNGSRGQNIEEISAAYPKDYEAGELSRLHAHFHLKQVNDTTKNTVANLAAMHPARSFFQDQAQAFLDRNGLKFRATLSDTKTPAWKQEGDACGHHYRVTIWRTYEHTRPQSISRKDWTARVRRSSMHPSRLTFDFWGSIKDAEDGKRPTPYDVLACISGDVYTPETFKDFCDEYGYESDSIKALQTFRRVSAFAKRLRAFFTAQELDALAEIR